MTLPKKECTIVKITDNLEFLPLDENLWVEKLSKFGKHAHSDGVQSCAKAGYDIRDSICELEKLYAKE
ncbi:hypothetical protein AGMMS49938_16640 [Fibrobacterales bacterium]|nr:hypothetical protein AGMMS49938_16640 [Fibrobacterales bacterium]